MTADHIWVQEHMAARALGGLSAADAARLDAHAADCPECSAELAAVRALDRDLDALFAPVRSVAPRPVGDVWASRGWRFGWRKPLVAGLAASVGLGLTGVVLASQTFGLPMRAGGLPLPGGGSLSLWGEVASTTGNAKGLAAADFDAGVRLWSEASQTEIEANGRALAMQGQSADGTRLKATAGWASRRADSPAGAPQGVPRPPVTTWHFQAPDRGEMLGDIAGRPDVRFDEQGKDQAKLYGYFGNNPADPDRYFKPGGDSFGTNGVERKPEATRQLGRPATPAAGQTPVVGKPAAGVELHYLKGTNKSEPVVEFDAMILPVQPAPKPAAPDPQAPPSVRKVIIRSGDIDFEVDAFDPAVATVTKLIAAIPGAYVATVNSEKLANGKVKGSVVVRVPPDHLDALVLDLRKEVGAHGELKGQRIGSQDITKQYTDLESRLKAARTMETRLLQVIKEGKGEIKQLLEAEKELGVWRTKIEEIEGELRYYSNLASLSTLTITLTEKQIRAAAGLTESERVQAGVEVEEVETAFREVLKAVAEAKGRVTKSELKQLAAGQFNATLQFEVAPDAAGPVRDRLRQLGRVARLEIDRVQQPTDPNTPVQKDAKLTRGDTVFQVQLYNLANVAPRETGTLQVAVTDVPAAYQALRDVVAKSGRILAAQLNEQDRANITAQLDFEVKRADDAAVRAALDAAGEVIARQVDRAAESDNVTDTKVRYRVTVLMPPGSGRGRRPPCKLRCRTWTRRRPWSPPRWPRRRAGRWTAR